MCFGQTQTTELNQAQRENMGGAAPLLRLRPMNAPGTVTVKQFVPNKFGNFASGFSGGYNDNLSSPGWPPSMKQPYPGATPPFVGDWGDTPAASRPTMKLGKLGAIIGAMVRGGFDAWGPGDIGEGFQRSEDASLNRAMLRHQMQRQAIADQIREQMLGVRQGQLDVQQQRADAEEIWRRAQALAATARANAPAKVDEKLITNENDPMAGNIVSEQGGAVIGTRPAAVTPEQVGLPPLNTGGMQMTNPPKLSLPSYYQSEREKKSGAPKPTVVTGRDESGTEVPYIIDTNPASPSFAKKIGSPGIQRSPLPDKGAAKTQQEQQFADAADKLISGFGGDTAKAEQTVRSADIYSATEKEGIIRHIRKQAPRGKQGGFVDRLRQQAGLP